MKFQKMWVWHRVLNRWSWITLEKLHSFSSSGSGDTDRWHINEGLCATCQCPRCPNLEKPCICPKVIQLHLLRTLVWHQLKFAISRSFYSHEPMSHKFTFKLYENLISPCSHHYIFWGLKALCVMISGHIIVCLIWERRYDALELSIED